MSDNKRTWMEVVRDRADHAKSKAEELGRSATLSPLYKVVNTDIPHLIAKLEAAEKALECVDNALNDKDLTNGQLYGRVWESVMQALTLIREEPK
jgi:hypothetical protein